MNEKTLKKNDQHESALLGVLQSLIDVKEKIYLLEKKGLVDSFDVDYMMHST